nr:hypothetical protein [uncultured Holophaga sp.]
MRPRYYCDHCGKGTGSPSFMRRHEPSCTANPARVCRMCGSATPPPELVDILLRPGNALEDWKAKMDDLRRETDNCPACILAVIRQSRVQAGMNEPDEEGYPDNSDMTWDGHTLGFDFRAEKKEALADLDERRAEHYAHRTLPEPPAQEAQP